MIECVPVPVLVTRDMRVSMKELEGNDPGLEPSGYEEGRSENARQEQLEAFRSRVSNQFFGLESRPVQVRGWIRGMGVGGPG